MSKVLLLAKHPDAPGGVLNYVMSLLDHFSGDIAGKHFPIGRSDKYRSRLGNIFFPLIDSWRLWREITVNQYDCIHINPSFNAKSLLRDGLLMLVIAAFHRGAVLVSFHGWDECFERKVAGSPLRRSLVRRIFGAADRILVLAGDFREGLLRIGLAGDKVFVTTTMYDARIFPQPAPPTQTEATGALRLVFLSRFVREKGVYELLAALKILQDRGVYASLNLVGDGPERQGMEEYVRTQKLTDRVAFSGYLRGEDKGRALQQAQIFVFPSYYGEGCPVALLEAMAAGLGIVTSRAGGIKDLIAGGELGLYLDTVTAPAIADAIATLDADRQLLRDMRRRNLARAENFDARQVVAQIEAVYREIIGRKAHD